MRMNLGPGQSATLRYTVRCPRGHYTQLARYQFVVKRIQSLRQRIKCRDRTDITVFPQVHEIEEALLRSNVPKMHAEPATLKTPGQGMNLFSGEYLPGDAFRMINDICTN